MNENHSEYSDASKGSYNLLQSRQAEFDSIGYYTGLTPPSRTAKYQGKAYSWDHAKHAIVFARSGSPEALIAAQTELLAIYDGQLESGLIPNQRRLYGGPGFEAKITGSKESNFYGQPPMGSMAAVELYDSLSRLSEDAAQDFASGIFDKVFKEAVYWPKSRKNKPEDYRLGVIASEETGMDESPIFDHQLPFPFKRLARQGAETGIATNAANIALHYFGRMWLDRQRKDLTHNTEGFNRAKELFWVMPVQLQAFTVANLYATAEIADRLNRPEHALTASNLARKVEDQMLNDVDDPVSPGMWDPAARNGRGMFRDLDRNGQPINVRSKNGHVTEEATSSSLMTLLLPNIKEHQLDSTIDMIDQEFMDEHGLSTVSKYSPSYDPDYKEKETGRWRGPAWLDQPWFVAEGLLVAINRDDISCEVKQKCIALLDKLRSTSLKSLNQWEENSKPIPEYYSHRDGKPFRLNRVTWFGWSNLGYVMPPNYNLSPFAKALFNNVSASTSLL